MNIKILGTGCPNCQKLEANTKQALVELKMKADMEKITEIQDIMSYGIMSLPALVVDEKVLMSGTVLNVEQVKEVLKNYHKPAGHCSCGGNC